VGLFGEGCDEVVVDVWISEYAGGGGVVLVGVEVVCDGDCFGCSFEVGVVEHDDGSFVIEFEVYLFDVVRC